MLGSVSKENRDGAAASASGQNSSSATGAQFAQFIKAASTNVVTGQSIPVTAQQGTSTAPAATGTPASAKGTSQSSPGTTSASNGSAGNGTSSAQTEQNFGATGQSYTPPSAPETYAPPVPTSQPATTMPAETEETLPGSAPAGVGTGTASTGKIPSRGATQPPAETADKPAVVNVPASFTEGYTEAVGTDGTPAFENFEAIEASQDFGTGAIRFTLKDGKKIYVLESKNAKMYKEVVAHYNAKQAVEKHPDHALISKAEDLPDVNALESKEKITQPDAETIVYETKDGKKGIIIKSLNPDLFNRALGLLDAVSEKAHADAMKEIPEGHALVKEGETLPKFSDIKNIKQMTVSDGSKILLFTTAENKNYAVSSLQAPAEFKELSTYFTTAQNLDSLSQKGYTPIIEQKQDYPDVRDIKKAGWNEGIQHGVTGYETKDGEKFGVAAENNPDLYAHIQGVNEYLSAPKEHQDGVEKLRNDGFELANVATASPGYWDIANITITSESARQDSANPTLQDARTGIMTVTTKDGKKIVVSERLTPFLFENMLGKKEGASALSTYTLQGYKWADEKTPPLSLKDKVEPVPVEGPVDPNTGAPSIIAYAVVVGDQKYLVSPEQMSGDDAKLMTEYNQLLQNGKDVPPELQAKVKELKGLPFMSSLLDNDALHGIPEENRNKLIEVAEAKDNTLITPSNPVFKQEDFTSKDVKNKIEHIKTEDVEKFGIIHFTMDGKTYSVSQAMNPEQFLFVQSLRQNHAGIEKSVAEGYRRAGEGDFKPDIKEVTKPGEFGPNVIRFTTESGEKIVVSEDDDPYLYNEAFTFYQNKVKKDIDGVWEKYGLEPNSEFSIANLPTTIKDQDGKAKSMYGVAMSRVISEYAALYNSGALDENDPRAKLIRYLGHEGILTGGMNINPYIEDNKHRLGDDTVRKHRKNGSDQPQFVKLSGEDMAEIINGNKLENALQNLFQDPKISADIAASLQETLSINVDKNAFMKKVESQVQNPNYIQALTDLKLSGNEDAVNMATNEIIQSVSMVAPDQVEAVQTSITNAMTTNLVERQLQDPAAIPQEFKDMARNDMSSATISQIKALLDGTPNLPDKALTTLKTYLDNPDNVKKTEASIAEFIAFSEDNPDMNSAEAALAFMEKKAADGSLTAADETALKTLFIVMENSNHGEKLVSLSQIGAALYKGFGNPEVIGADANARMSFLETTLIPEMLNNPMLGEKTKEVLAPYMEEASAVGNKSQNMFTEEGKKTEERPSSSSTSTTFAGNEDTSSQKTWETSPVISPQDGSIPAPVISPSSSVVTGGSRASTLVENKGNAQADRVLALMNGWAMNITGGLTELSMGITSLAGNRNGFKESFISEEAYNTQTASEGAMIAGGSVQAIYGMGQAGFKMHHNVTAPPRIDADGNTVYNTKGVVKKAKPVEGTITHKFLATTSNVTNGVQAASSLLFGAGMFGMGIAGMLSKHRTPAGDAANMLTNLGGVATIGSAGFWGKGIYQNAVASQISANAGKGTASSLSKIPLLGSKINSAANAASAASKTATSVGQTAATAMKIGGAMGIAGMGVGMVGGIVFGAQALDQAIKTDDKALQAISGAQIATTAISGAIMGALMVMGAAGPIALMAAGLIAIPAAILGALINEIRGDPQIKKIHDQETDQLKAAEKDGFMRSDGWDRFEFARYYMYNEGRKEQKDDESFIEAQPEMWDHFKNTEGKNGSSNNRLDWDKHKKKEG